MRKFTSLFLAFMILTGQVHAGAFKAPDILVDSKLDFDWSGLLIGKVRRLLKNYDIADPFAVKFEKDFVVSESLLNDYLPDSSKSLITDLGTVLGMNILKGETKIVLSGLAYDIKNFKTDLKASEVKNDGLVIASDFSASELSLTADKVSLSLEIPSANGKSSPVIQIDILGAKVGASEDRLVKFFAKMKIQDQKDAYQLKFIQTNFDGMADAIGANPERIDLSYKKVVIPEVSIKVGGKNLKFDNKKIEKLIKDNHEGIKGLLLAQTASLLKKGMGETVLKALESYKIQKEYWLDANILKSQIEISQFAGSFDRNNISVDLPGDFCTTKKYAQLQKKCVFNKDTPVSKSRLDRNHHADSVDHMRQLLDRGEANFVASISEDYVNKLLVATYDAGLWKQTLDEAGVELGPKKVFMRLDNQGESGTLFMDVIYKPKKIERIALGSKEIRFPLVLDVAMRIEKHDGIPVMIIRMNDVDLTEQTLKFGRPDLDLPSSIQDTPRLKGKVIKTIRSKLSGMKNKDVIDLRYPELKGLGLEKIDFISDGNGRMNAVMRLQDLLQSDD